MKKTKNVSMMQLPDGRDAFVMTQVIHDWNINDVYEWMKHICNGKFKKYAIEFRKNDVDGEKLVEITFNELQDDYGMNDPVVRRQFLREIDHIHKQTGMYSIYIHNILKIR